MALFFSSGGGRLGNQILNLIHLMALSYEYNIEVFKISDLFIQSKDKSLVFQIKKDNINWKLIKNIENKFTYKLFLKCFIILIHLYFNILHNKRSYKIGFNKNYPRFVVGKKLGFNFSILTFLKESKIYDVAITGWGLRDWNLVEKHKKLIIKNLVKLFEDFVQIKELKANDYLLVHIRRTDFLDVDSLKKLNFSNKLWLKSILEFCNKYSIKEVVIFSDEEINNFLINSLKMNRIKVIVPEISDTSNFLELFFNYISNASSVMCNSSTLTLSISFLFHKYIYLPSENAPFQRIPIKDAHKSFPTHFNWK